MSFWYKSCLLGRFVSLYFKMKPLNLCLVLLVFCLVDTCVGGEPKEIVRSSGEYSPEVEEEITPSNPGGTEMPKEEDLPEAETYPENTRKKRNVNEEETTLMSILDPRLKRSVSKNNEGNLNSVVRIKRKMPKIQGPK